MNTVIRNTAYSVKNIVLSTYACITNTLFSSQTVYTDLWMFNPTLDNSVSNLTPTHVQNPHLLFLSSCFKRNYWKHSYFVLVTVTRNNKQICENDKQQPSTATCPYLEPYQSSICHPIRFLYDPHSDAAEDYILGHAAASVAHRKPTFRRKLVASSPSRLRYYVAWKHQKSDYPAVQAMQHHIPNDRNHHLFRLFAPILHLHAIIKKRAKKWNSSACFACGSAQS
jgi:hypothetical protein